MRALHAGAWWAWALALAAAATRTTNPVVLLLLVAVGWLVVVERRSPHGASTFGFFVRIACFVFAVRLVFEVVFGSSLPGHVLVRLPSLPLPAALAGLRIGGAVTAEAMLTATYTGMQLAVLLICVGAANALASPRRLLRSLPGALYELGVAVTVALSVAPQLSHAVTRVRRARRLRGSTSSGLRGWAGVALPVLQEALEQSVDLAAAMDARGFGRRGAVTRGRRRLVTGTLLAGLLAVATASYGLLATGSPAQIGMPLLVGGSVVAGAALLIGGRGVVRSQYRPDEWRGAEWAVLASGLAALAGVVAAGRIDPGSLHTGAYPIAAPQLPWPALAGILLAALPAWLAPRRRSERAAAETVSRTTLAGVAR